MKVLVLGGVAAGTKAAAKLKRESRDIDVKILTKGRDISYAGCGLPYFIGEIIPDRSDLIVNTPEKFSSLTGVEVVTGAEVTAVDFPSKIKYSHGRYSFTFTIISACSNTFSHSQITALTSLYSSSLNPLPIPAPLSTKTVCPAFIKA